MLRPPFCVGREGVVALNEDWLAQRREKENDFAPQANAKNQSFAKECNFADTPRAT